MKHIYKIMSALLAGIIFLAGCGKHPEDTPIFDTDNVVMNDNLEVFRHWDGTFLIKCGNTTVLSDVERFAYKMSRRDSLGIFISEGRADYYHAYYGLRVTNGHFKRAWTFSEGIAAVIKEEGYVEFIDKKGNTVPGLRFPYQNEPTCDIQFHGGKCAVPCGKKYGVIDRTGAWILLPEHDKVEAGPDYAVVFDDGMRRQIAYDGTVLTTFLFDEIERLSYGGYSECSDTYEEETATGFFAYEVAGRWGLMGKDGQRLTAPIYDHIHAVSERLFAARLDCDYDYILLNDKGETIK